MVILSSLSMHLYLFSYYFCWFGFDGQKVAVPLLFLFLFSFPPHIAYSALYTLAFNFHSIHSHTHKDRSTPLNKKKKAAQKIIKPTKSEKKSKKKLLFCKSSSIHFNSLFITSLFLHVHRFCYSFFTFSSFSLLIHAYTSVLSGLINQHQKKNQINIIILNLQKAPFSSFFSLHINVPTRHMPVKK